jgi:hypothetical protein
MYKAIYQMLCMAYATLLRDLVKKAVDDPKEEWDDVLLNVMDRLFDYKP